MSGSHFQQGQDALKFLNTAYDTQVRPSDLRELDQAWNDLNIINDVGISEESINKFSKLLLRVNGERPEGNRHSTSVLTEKLLESISNASRHFSELAMKEIDAAIGQREFDDGSGNRNFIACVEYYNRQWAHAVKKKILTASPPVRRGATHKPDMDQLSRVFEAKTVLEQHTTVNVDNLSGYPESLCGSIASGRSGEVICDNCRGLGHMKRVCLSAARFRSLQQVIEALRTASERGPVRGASEPPSPKPARRQITMNNRNYAQRSQGKGKAKGVRFAEDAAHKVEADNRPTKGAAGPQTMPLALDSYFDDEITSVRYVNDTTLSVNPQKNLPWHSNAFSLIGGGRF